MGEDLWDCPFKVVAFRESYSIMVLKIIQVSQQTARPSGLHQNQSQLRSPDGGIEEVTRNPHGDWGKRAFETWMFDSPAPSSLPVSQIFYRTSGDEVTLLCTVDTQGPLDLALTFLGGEVYVSQLHRLTGGWWRTGDLGFWKWSVGWSLYLELLKASSIVVSSAVVLFFLFFF